MDHEIFPENALEIKRYITADERDAIPAEDFAGPDRTYPCDTQEHLDAAARLIGHASDPAAVKKKAIEIAKRKGLTLPESWQKDTKEERAMSLPGNQVLIYAPFSRIDEDKREVIGVATTESIDGHKTIIGYDASKKAFGRADKICIREMHQPKAVGKGIEWEADESGKKIILRAQISRSADGDNVWTKIQENILSGFSIAGNAIKWGNIQRDSANVPYLEDYDLTEVSLVDNPSNKDCMVSIIRADGIDESVLAALDEVQADEPAAEPAPEVVVETPESDVERAGKKISSANKQNLHTIRDMAMQTCADGGCDECTGIMNAGQNGSDNEGDLEMPERVMRMVETRLDALDAKIDQILNPVYTRLQAMLGDFARSNHSNTEFQRQLATVATQVTELKTEVKEIAELKSSQDNIRSDVSKVLGLVERIDASPTPGGPMFHATPANKRLAGQTSPRTEEDVRRAYRDELQRSGALQNNLDDQVRVAATAIKPMYPPRS